MSPMMSRIRQDVEPRRLPLEGPHRAAHERRWARAWVLIVSVAFALTVLAWMAGER